MVLLWGATRAQGQGHTPPRALTPRPLAGGHTTAGQDPGAQGKIWAGQWQQSLLRAGMVAESLFAHKVTLRVDSAPSPRVSFGDSHLPMMRKQLRLVGEQGGPKMKEPGGSMAAWGTTAGQCHRGAQAASMGLSRKEAGQGSWRGGRCGPRRGCCPEGCLRQLPAETLPRDCHRPRVCLPAHRWWRAQRQGPVAPGGSSVDHLASESSC